MRRVLEGYTVKWVRGGLRLVSPLLTQIISAQILSTQIISALIVSILVMPTSLWAMAIQPYEIPTAYSLPSRIAVDADDTLWFVESNSNKIGRFQLGAGAGKGPDKGTFREFVVPTKASEPSDVVVDAGGVIWFTEKDANQLGRFDPVSEKFKEFDIPTFSSLPLRIAIGQRGHLWFTEFYGNKVGRFNTETETFTEYPLPTPESQPSGIVVDQQGIVWFLETRGNKLGRLHPESGAVEEFELPTPFSTPKDITVDQTGVLWFGARSRQRLLSFDPQHKRFKEFTIPGGGVIESLAVYGGGNILFTLGRSGKLAIFNVQREEFIAFDALAGESRPFGVLVDSKGNIWFSDLGKNTLVKVDRDAVSQLLIR